MARPASKETWFTVFASMVAGVLIVLAMIYIGLELLL